MKSIKKEIKLKEKKNEIICKHCHKKITNPLLLGISLICPFCKKPINGEYHS